MVTTNLFPTLTILNLSSNGKLKGHEGYRRVYSSAANMGSQAGSRMAFCFIS